MAVNVTGTRVVRRMPLIKSYKMVAKEDIAVSGMFRKDLAEGAAVVEIIGKFTYTAAATFTPDAEIRWLKDGKVMGSVKLSELDKLDSAGSTVVPNNGVMYSDAWGTEIAASEAGSSTLRTLLDLTLLGNGQGGLGEGWSIEIKDATVESSGSVSPTYTINIGTPALPGQAVIYTSESITFVSDGWKVLTDQVAAEAYIFTEQTSAVDAQIASGTGNVLVSVNEDNQACPTGGWFGYSTTKYGLGWSTRYAFRPILAQGLQAKMNQALATADGAVLVLGLVV